MWQLATPLALVLLPLPLLLSPVLSALQAESGALRVPPTIAAKLKAGQKLPESKLLRTFLRWFVWIGLVVAIADPRTALTARALPASGREIVLVLDFSGSMMDRDLMLGGKPARREDVMKQVAEKFIKGRAGDRVGLVVFSSDAYVAAPLTFDLAAVAHALDNVTVKMMGESKTAIGDGLGLALKRLRHSSAPERLIVLLSDGGNNAGSAEPIPVARFAKSLGVRIDTIALGSSGAEASGSDGGAVDAATLKTIAAISGGKAFSAQSGEELEQVSRSIDRLEKGRSKAPPSIIYQPLWIYPAAIAFLAALGLLLLDRRRA